MEIRNKIMGLWQVGGQTKKLRVKTSIWLIFCPMTVFYRQASWRRFDVVRGLFSVERAALVLRQQHRFLLRLDNDILCIMSMNDAQCAQRVTGIAAVQSALAPSSAQLSRVMWQRLCNPTGVLSIALELEECLYALFLCYTRFNDTQNT